MEKPATSIILSLILSITISISIPSVRSQLSVTRLLLPACPLLFPTSSRITVYTQADRTDGVLSESVYSVAQSSITPTSPSNFGLISVSDEKLTAGPDYNSQELGRAQGTLTSADLSELALSMHLNFYFTVGIYNGSTISILGRNPVLQQNRKLPVVGGSGIFRCARGYAIVNTYSMDQVTLDGVLTYEFYVDY